MTNKGENKRTTTNNSAISTREAAEQSGFSSRHIQKLIKTGKLSATRTDNGSYLIDKSEFYRVFPDLHRNNSENLKRTRANSDELNSRTVLEPEIRHLKEMLSEKNKQNEFIREQLAKAEIEKTMLLETLNSNQRLLEHEKKNKRKRFLGIF